MKPEEITPIIDELARVLEGNATRTEIEEQVHRFADVFQVTDPERIKASVLKKYGMVRNETISFTTADHVMKKIGDLTGSETAVDIEAKVVSAGKRTINTKNGSKNIVSGVLGDETGTVSFTVWDGDGCALVTNASYRFKNAYSKTWNGTVQINIGNNGAIEQINRDIEVQTTVQQSAQAQRPSAGKMKIADLKGSEPSVDIEAKAVFAERKDITVRGEPRTIISGILGDETGTASFTVWNADGVQMDAGDCYLLRNAYTKLWNEKVQINIGNSGSVERSDAVITASVTMPSAPSSPGVRKKIGELTGSDSNVDLTVKAVFAEKRDVTIKGEPRTIISGTFGDDTGTAQFTAWEGADRDIVTGGCYEVKGAYTKLWNDRIQINLGRNSTFAPVETEIEVPEKPQQIVYSSSVAKVCDLKEGIGTVTVSGKIVSMEKRMVNSQGAEKPVWSGILADETGKIQFSSWVDPQVGSGDSIRVAGGYIRSWKGIPQLNFGERAEISRIDDTFGDVSSATASRKTVGEILRTGGGIDMTVVGTIVDLRAGSGIIRRCPECNRSILGTECMTHGAVEAIRDLRMKVVLDDSTGGMSAILNRDITEKLTGITLSDAVAMMESTGSNDSVAKALADRMVFRNVSIRGNVMSDDYGPSMIVRSADYEERDVRKDAESLLSKIEEAIM